MESFGPDDPRIGDWHAVRAPADPLVPGVRCWLARNGGTPVARLACGASPWGSFIGWYEAMEPDAGIALLDRVRRQLSGTVVGPLNGSTWARYRWSLPGSGDAPPFTGEPCNPPEYPAQWDAAGFRIVAEYESRIFDAPEPDVIRLRAAESRATEQGVKARALQADRWDDELRDIHGLSLASFAGNPFYTPVELESFREANDKLWPLLDPRLVRLARDSSGALIGLGFAYPDGRTGRVVLKTLATAPRARGLGLATLLTEQVHAAARDGGASGVIHALMHVSNRSAQMSADRRTRQFRRYALYGA